MLSRDLGGHLKDCSMVCLCPHNFLMLGNPATVMNQDFRKYRCKMKVTANAKPFISIKSTKNMMFLYLTSHNLDHV